MPVKKSIRYLPALVMFFCGKCIAANPIETGIPYNLEDPKKLTNAQLETVVRVCVGEAQTDLNCCGMNTFFETRLRDTKHYLWYADVNFGADTKVKDRSVFGSRIVIKYSTTNQYFSNPQGKLSYGTFSDKTPKGADLKTNDPIRTQSVSRHEYRDDLGKDVDNYQALMAKSLFEFTLENPLSLKDLHSKIAEYKRGGELVPQYCVDGYSITNKVYNCATFSVALLTKLGIGLNQDPTFQKYVNFKIGTVWGWWSYAGLAAGAVVGGGVIVATGGVAPLLASGVYSAQAALAGGAVLGGAVAGLGVVQSEAVLVEAAWYGNAAPHKIVGYIADYANKLANPPSFIDISGHLFDLGNQKYNVKDTLVHRKRITALDGEKEKYILWYENFRNENRIIIYNIDA